MYTSKKRSVSNSTILIDNFLNGFFAVGSGSDIWSEDSWKGIKDTRGALLLGCGVQNDGILCVGQNSTISMLGSNFGVTITGHATVIDEPTKNNGVFITGTVNETSSRLFDENGKVVSDGGTPRTHHDPGGSGIYIRGVIHNPKTNQNQSGSLVQFSDSSLDTILKGNVVFDASFNIKDAQGKYIIRNGVRQS